MIRCLSVMMNISFLQRLGGNSKLRKLFIISLIIFSSAAVVGCDQSSESLREETNTPSFIIEDTSIENKKDDSKTTNESSNEDEKIILKETTFTSQKGTVNTATLFYNGDIRLSVNHAQTVIDTNVKDDFLSKKDTHVPQPSYSLHTLGNHPLIAVVHDFPTVYGPGTKLDLFDYSDASLQPIFSTLDMKLQIDAIDYERGEVAIWLPFVNTTVTHVLSSKEKENTEEKLLEFQANHVKITDEYIESIKDGILCSPIKVAFTDMDDDGIEEILILSNIQSAGARTPVYIYTDAVFVFKVLDNDIQFKEILFG